MGRKRFLPDIVSRNAVVRGYAERNAVNAPIQGSAADIIKRAMIDIYNDLTARNMKSKMIMQVHDELNFNVPIAESERVRALVVYEMEHAAELRVRLLSDVHIGKTWYDAKG